MTRKLFTFATLTALFFAPGTPAAVRGDELIIDRRARNWPEPR